MDFFGIWKCITKEDVIIMNIDTALKMLLLINNSNYLFQKITKIQEYYPIIKSIIDYMIKFIKYKQIDLQTIEYIILKHECFFATDSISLLKTHINTKMK